MRIIAALALGLHLAGNLSAQLPIIHEQKAQGDPQGTPDSGGCQFELGPHVTICSNASFTLNPHPEPGVQYNWTGENLSCYDCPSPVVSGLSTGQYTYVGMYVSPGCVLFDSIIVTVLPGQAPQYTIAPSQAICSGESVALGGPAEAGTNYFWFSLPPGFTSSSSNPVVTPAGDIQYILFVNNNSCPLTTVDSVSIQVFHPPDIQLIPDTVVCQGEPVSLNNVGPQSGVSYAWSPDDGSLDDPQSANPLATPAGSTDYTLVASNPGCAVTQTVTVNVIPIAISSPDPDTSAICRGGSVTLDLTVQPASLPVSWSPAQGLELQAAGHIAVASPVSGTLYTASVENGGCAQSLRFYIHVDSLPADASLTPGDTSICAGAEVLLFSAPYDPDLFQGLSFSWAPAVGQVGPDSLPDLLVRPADTVTYRRIRSLGVCRDTAFALVRVQPAFQISLFPSDTTVCLGTPVALHAILPAGLDAFSWSPDDGLSCSDCPDPVVNAADTTLFVLTGWIGDCSVQAEALVRVVPGPVVQLPEKTQWCLGDSILLNAVSDSLTSYVWTSSDPLFGTVTDPMPVVTPQASTAYDLYAEKNGCVVDTAFTLSISSASLTLSADTTICRNRSVQLKAEATVPGQYQWSTGQTSQVITVTPVETTVYFVTFTHGGVCQLTDSVTVALDGEAPVFEPPADRLLCPGESILLNSLAIPGATYLWSSVPAGFTSSQATPVVSPLQPTVYTVTAQLDQCVNTAQIEVFVSNPVVEVTPDTAICSGEPVLLWASSSVSGGTFEWIPGGPGQEWIDYPDTDRVYIVEYRFGDGCLLTDSVQVSLIPGFSLDILSAPDSSRLDVGTPLLLTAMVLPDQDLGGFDFTWRVNDVEDIGFGPEIEFPISTNDTSVFFLLTAVSPSGCVEKSLIHFTVVQPRVVVPNAFTPDGDGVNDTFGLVTLEGKTTLEILQIYNRWGQIVFSTSEPQGRWNGMVNSGEAPSDAYFYVLRWRRADGALMPVEKGEVLLIR